MIFLDFETRSRVDLRAHGASRYTEDDTTELLCGVAIDSDAGCIYVWSPFEPSIALRSWKVSPTHFAQVGLDHDAFRFTQPLLGSDDPPPEVLAAVRAGVPVVAHNAPFDCAVWEGLGLPPASRWIDTLSLARRASLPGRLDLIGQILFGLGKDSGGVHQLKISSAPLKSGRFLDPDGPRLSILIRYCMRDVLLMLGMWRLMGFDAPHMDDPVLAVHDRVNRRGIGVDLQFARALRDAEDELKARKIQHAERVTEGEVTAAVLASQTQLRAWLKRNGIEVEDVQAPTLRAWMRGRPDGEESTVAAVISARLATARVLSSKMQAVIDRTSADGRVRGSLAYYGAHTGRWAGRGIQPQNFMRPIAGLPDDAAERVLVGGADAAVAIASEVGCPPGDVTGSLARGVLVAPPGRWLAVADYSGIEARALLWLANDAAGLIPYTRSDSDPYRLAAAEIYGVSAGKITKAQRMVGKVAVLALGYQGGPGAFAAMAAGYGLDLSGLDVDAIVEAWRDSRPRVAGIAAGWWVTPEGRRVRIRQGGYWRETQWAARAALKRMAPEWVHVRGDGPKVLWGCRRSPLQGIDLQCQLPSGRILVYRDARIERVETRWGSIQDDALTYRAPYQRGGEWVRKQTYGGKLVENVTQAVCRDLLAHALVGLEQAGLCPVLTVHDEVICEVSSPDRLEDVKRIILDAPGWAEGLPLAVEAGVSRRYGKI